jgi:hypothetical protein
MIGGRLPIMLMGAAAGLLMLSAVPAQPRYGPARLSYQASKKRSAGKSAKPAAQKLQRKARRVMRRNKK